MEFKTKSGKKVKFKEISVLELCKLKDVLHKSTDFSSEKNTFTAPFECMYRWLSAGIEGFTDEMFKDLSENDRVDIFIEMQNHFILGEEKASK